jgi:RNA polymerase sigma-70 factor, ECF subfamily
MYMNTDTMTLAAAKTYDQQTLVAIYEAYNAELYRYAVRLLDDQDIAEECVAETFSRLLQGIRRGHGPQENVRAYLYRIAHNWIMDYYRRKPRQAEPLDVDKHIDIDANPQLVVADYLERERVRVALLNLPDDQQKVIQLRFFEDWAHEEVAELLGKTVDATRALQYRALTSLRKLLSEQEVA